jgi:kumamolisin
MAATPTNLSDRITVNVLLTRPEYAMSLKDWADSVISGEKQPLSREHFQQIYGATDETIATVVAFAEEHQLIVVSSDSASATVRLEGSVEQFNNLFNITMVDDVDEQDTPYRGVTGDLTIPAEIAGVVQSVDGFSNKRIFGPLLRKFNPEDIINLNDPGTGSLTPAQVGGAYNFPAGTGSGVNIGILEWNGGWNQSDVTASFANVGLASPTITDINIPDGYGGYNKGSGSLEGAETLLDIFCAGGVAPGAHLYIYNGDPNISYTGFASAISYAVHDTSINPKILSISYGTPETYVPNLFALEDIFQSAVVLGITVFVSSGDQGSQTGGLGSAIVAYPGSSAYVVSCGGTTLIADTSTNTILSETVWNNYPGQTYSAGGGGISASINKPTWQNGLTYRTYQNGVTGSDTALPKRGVPDFSGNADPSTGYRFWVSGTQQQYGGTSAVAPLFAGLFARIIASYGSTGFINQTIYSNTGVFNDVTSGNNAPTGTTLGYAATLGWDAATGLGSPNGTQLSYLFRPVTSVQNLSTFFIAINVPTSFLPVTGAGGYGTLSYSAFPSLPNGLNLDTASGLITGTATTGSNGTSYSITVTDQLQPTPRTSNKTFTLNLADPLVVSITTSSKILSTGTAVSFSYETAVGGYLNRVWSILPALPTGLSINTATGVISGTPVSPLATTTYQITVQDLLTPTPQLVLNNFNLYIIPPVVTTTVITRQVLEQNQQYNFTPVTVTGGVGQITYTVSPTLPGGLSLNSTTGAISGSVNRFLLASTYSITATSTLPTGPGQVSTSTFVLGALKHVEEYGVAFLSLSTNTSASVVDTLSISEGQYDNTKGVLGRLTTDNVWKGTVRFEWRDLINNNAVASADVIDGTVSFYYKLVFNPADVDVSRPNTAYMMDNHYPYNDIPRLATTASQFTLVNNVTATTVVIPVPGAGVAGQLYFWAEYNGSDIYRSYNNTRYQPSNTVPWAVNLKIDKK